MPNSPKLRAGQTVYHSALPRHGRFVKFRMDDGYVYVERTDASSFGTREWWPPQHVCTEPPTDLIEQEAALTDPTTTESSTSDWQTAIREAQAKKREAEQEREEEIARKQAEYAQQEATEFARLLNEAGVPVPNDITEPKWTSPDGFIFSLEQGHNAYARHLYISCDVPDADPAMYDVYEDNLERYVTRISKDVPYRGFKAHQIADALDELVNSREHFRKTNALQLETARKRAAQPGTTPADADLPPEPDRSQTTRIITHDARHDNEEMIEHRIDELLAAGWRLTAMTGDKHVTFLFQRDSDAGQGDKAAVVAEAAAIISEAAPPAASHPPVVPDVLNPLRSWGQNRWPAGGVHYGDIDLVSAVRQHGAAHVRSLLDDHAFAPIEAAMAAVGKGAADGA